MSIKLRELIRAVRACKTAAEERATIAKECALIRTAFKEQGVFMRTRHLVGLPAVRPPLYAMLIHASKLSN
jgi:AP-1 complex subunit gamma-1